MPTNAVETNLKKICLSFQGEMLYQCDLLCPETLKWAIETSKSQNDFQIFLLILINKEMKVQIKIPLFTKQIQFDYINNKLRK